MCIQDCAAVVVDVVVVVVVVAVAVAVVDASTFSYVHPRLCCLPAAVLHSNSNFIIKAAASKQKAVSDLLGWLSIH